MVKVKAIKQGYDGIKIREVGEVFEFGGKLGKWLVEAGKEEKVGAPKKEAAPALSPKHPKAP